MADYCGSAHPDDADRVCRQNSLPHRSHADGAGTWPNPEYVGPTMDSLRQRREHRAKGGAVKQLGAFVGGSTLSSEVEEKWDRQGWVDGAKSVVREFLLHRSEPFTTAEHWWPLLDAPQEKRAMVQVVRWAVRQGLMREVGARRLRDIYRTRDGHEFQENKLVSVYQSRICRPT